MQLSLAHIFPSKYHFSLKTENLNPVKQYSSRAQVGAEPMRAWISGKVVAFDDSFEHEVVMRGSVQRPIHEASVVMARLHVHSG